MSKTTKQLNFVEPRFLKESDVYTCKIDTSTGEISIWLSRLTSGKYKGEYKMDVYFSNFETGSDTSICLGKKFKNPTEAFKAALRISLEFLLKERSKIVAPLDRLISKINSFKKSKVVIKGKK